MGGWSESRVPHLKMHPKRTRGGFEVVSMDWKEGKLEKVVVKSTLGGKLRLRTRNALKFKNGEAIKTASGENENFFYYTEKIPAPIISPKAAVTPAQPEETFLYDVPAKAGKVYEFVAQ